MLTYDAHTSDAFFFSLSLNGTRSVVCFREEAAALRRQVERRVDFPAPFVVFFKKTVSKVARMDEYQS